MQISDILRSAIELGASDLHLKAGAAPHLRIAGRLTPLEHAAPLTASQARDMAFDLMHERQRIQFEATNEADFARTLEGVGRFRINIYRQRGSIGMVLRVVPGRVKPLSELDLPPVIERICEEQRGLVLVTGTTGSGKSTTLAAMVDRINATRAEHILTIEDPIEFMHQDQKAVVNQREVASDTAGFAVALRAALRQDPDVILVGEMRDHETIETALTAAETGHLVLSTLHTLDAAETIQRIISVFSIQQQPQVRMQLASVLRAVVSQRLMRRCDQPGRVPAVEVLVSTSYVRDCIVIPERTPLIREAISKGGSQYGMQTFDQSLYDLWQRKLIDYETALDGASNRDEFKLRAQGISSAGVSPGAAARDAEFDRGF